MRTVSLLFLLFMSAVALAACETSPIEPSEVYTHELVRLHEAELSSLAKSADLRKFLKKNRRQPASLKKIIDLDNVWMTDSDLRSSVLENSVALKFQSILDDERYGIVELMLTDGFGALRAARPAPTDYWQGDEEKFYSAVTLSQFYVSKAAWDESTQTNSFFISMPIESNGKFIGVLIAGLKITQEYMMQMPIEELIKLQTQ